MPPARLAAIGLLCLAACLDVLAGGTHSRAQALKALRQQEPQQRLQAIERLAAVGTMADAERLLPHLRDADPTAREATEAALWMIWSRSGDRAVDRLFERGVEHLREGRYEQALLNFSSIVKRRPSFAEGWNKRATVLFLMGQDEASLRDCAEVLKRNRHHFGALSGMAQIHIRRGDPENALRAYERALQVNPNLEGGPQTLQWLEEAVRQLGGQRT